MRGGKWFYVFLAALIAVAIAGLQGQRRTAAELRGEIARQRAQAQERSALQAEHERLVASQVTAAELAELAARRMAAEQLRARLATMQSRMEATARSAASPRAETEATTTLSLKGNSLAYQLWQNVGQATPDAAFQTALWAAAAGDVDSLAGLLELEPGARDEAAAAFDRLPAAVQNELGTPERLIALLTAVDVPLGRAAILGQIPTATDTKVSAQLIDAGGQAKEAVFSMRADGDRWRLIVPAAVVRKYAGWLHAPSAAAGTH